MNKQHFCFALFPRRSCSRLNLAWSLQQSWGRAFLVSLKVLSLGAVLCLLFVGTGRSLWRELSRFMQVMSQQETQSCGWLIFCHSVIYSVVIFSCIWLLSLRELRDSHDLRWLIVRLNPLLLRCWYRWGGSAVAGRCFSLALLLLLPSEAPVISPKHNRVGMLPVLLTNDC